MSKRKSNFLFLLFLLLCFQTTESQNLLSSDELENLLEKAELQSQNYGKVFQNLSAEELKTKIYYKSDGGFDEKRVTKSIFIVYQSPNKNFAQEFRNVLESNGKSVIRNEKETAAFFEKLARKDTPQEEYEKLRKESLRYDGPKNPWGITLNQQRPFSKNLLADFRFKVVGKDKIEGRDIWIIEYEQIKTSPYILSNPTSEEAKKYPSAIQYNMPISDELRPSNPLLKGKIWLDAETAQMWRNEYKLILNPGNLSKPVEAGEYFYEYQSSKFGILVPKKISITSFVIKGKTDKNLSVKKDLEITFEYSKFSEFITDAKVSESKN